MFCRLFTIVFLIASILPRAVLSAPTEVYPLNIGFILPLSGDWAFLGNGIRDGALLAQADLKEQGTAVNLIFEDNHGDLATSAGLASRLISDTHVDALISIISGVGKILRPIATKASILNIGICSDTDVADGKNSFINYLTAKQGVKKFVDYFTHVLPGATLGVFALNEAGFQRIANELEQQAAGKLKIVRIENFDKGSADFRSQLLRMKSIRPGAFLLLGLSPEIELIANQARAMQMQIPLTSIEGFGLASDKKPFEGSWFVDSAVPSDEFQARFRQRYNREVTSGVGHSYDSVMLLAAASNAARGDRKDFALHFRRISVYDGVIGRMTVRPDGVISSEALIKVIKDGKSSKVTP